MTPNDIRVRLAAALSRRNERGPVVCPHCGGTGTVSRRLRTSTTTDVGKAIGVSRAQVSNFMIGKSDLSFPVGLRLIAWLDDQEAAQ